MRRIPTAMAALLASACIFSLAPPARAQTYPVCLAAADEDGMRCDYTSLEQCRATASGIGGNCFINPASAVNAFASTRRVARRAH